MRALSTIALVFIGAVCAAAGAADCRVILEAADRLAAAQQYAAALAKYEEATAACPELAASDAVQLALAQCHDALGHLDEAAAAYQRVLSMPDSPLAPRALYGLAFCRLKQNENEAAAKLFKELAQKHPNCEVADEALWNAATLYERLGELEPAAALFDRAAQTASTKERADRALYFAAAALVEAKKHPEAARRLDALLQREPAAELKARAQWLLAQVRQALGQFAKARAVYELLAGGNDERAFEAALGAAQCAQKLRDWRSAASLLRSAMEKQPQSLKMPEALMALGTAHLELEEYAEARAEFERLLELQPEGSLAPAAKLALAQAMIRQPDYPAAAEQLRSLLKSHPDAPFAAEARRLLGVALIGLAAQAEANRQTQQALAFYEEMIESTPDSYRNQGLYHAARICHDEKQWDRGASLARAYLEKPQVAEDETVAALWLGDACSALGDLAAAQQAYERAAAKAKDIRFADDLQRQLLRRALFAAAQSARKREQWLDAAALSERYLDGKFSQESAAIQLGLGIALSHLARYEEAEQWLAETILSKDLTLAAEAQFELAQCFLRQERWEEAAAEAVRVDSLYGDERFAPAALAMAARCMEKLGRAAEAERYRERLRRNYPDSPEAKSLQ